MKVLIINCGSSSLKYQLMNMTDESVLANGVVEKIGLGDSFIKHNANGEKSKIEKVFDNHTEAIKKVLDLLTDSENGVISSLDEIDATGHRVVHGGELFKKSRIINDEVIKGIESCNDLAPLHNPANLLGINACKEIFGDKPMVAVFDTAFHQTMPIESYIYPIPYEYYEKYKVRKYGFHGTSHKYIAHRAAEILGKDISKINTISCHLGNGASLCAIKKGKSHSTSMGFTPLAGTMMGTRCGNIDPAIISFLMEKEGLNIKEVENILNKKSGLAGLSGVGSDCRDVEDEAWNKCNLRAQLALDKFGFRVKETLGSHAAVLDGVDVIVFTAGLGEMSPELREFVCKDMEHFGIHIDHEKNKVRGKESIISADDSKITVMVIPTDEELMIARDTKELVD